jgi:hypothetical protein
MSDFLDRWENECEEHATMVAEERDKMDVEYVIEALTDLASSLESEERQTCWNAVTKLQELAENAVRFHAYSEAVAEVASFKVFNDIEEEYNLRMDVIHNRRTLGL